VDAALGVDLVDIDLERLLLGIAEERGRAGDREHRADPDLRRRAAGAKRKGKAGCGSSEFRGWGHRYPPGLDRVLLGASLAHNAAKRRNGAVAAASRRETFS